jgi:hypothetical protein
MRDVVDATLFHIFCSECKEKYHCYGSNKPNDACANFVQLHINIEGHVKAYKS